MPTNVRPPEAEFSWALNDVKRRALSIKNALAIDPQPTVSEDVTDLQAIKTALEIFLIVMDDHLTRYAQSYGMQGQDPVMTPGC